MVDWGTVVATAAVTTVVSDTVREARQSSEDDSGGTEASADGTEVQEMSERHLEELVRIERTNNVPPESVDAFVGESVEIPAGGSASVEVTPTQGNNLRVSSVYWDRREDVTYEHFVGGIKASSAHEANFTRPKKVTQGGSVLGAAENDAASSVTIDYELEGWAIPTGTHEGDH